MHYHPREQTLLVECSPGTIVVIGPKAEDFCERFCSHKVASIKAYGKDILRVSLAHQQGKSEE